MTDAMTDRLNPVFTVGTQRLATPEDTLARIEPLLPRIGITRLAEITGLDRDLGVPTYTAVRPQGHVLQTGNGKGLTATAAKVSALMEALELHHAEHPDTERFSRASESALRSAGDNVVVPTRDSADRRFYYSRDYLIDWVEAEELVTGRQVWVPASAAWFIEPTVYQTTTNGLASGNHFVEATLHGLYEVLERDALAQLVADGALRIRGYCRVIDLASVPGDHIQHIFECIRAAHSHLVLLWVPTNAPVHVFWAILLNHHADVASTAFNAGAGAHLDMSIAASRAVTEAIQSRLTMVQSARDDIIHVPAFSRKSAAPGVAFRYFADLQTDARWDDVRASQGQLDEVKAAGLDEQLTWLLDALAAAGHDCVVRVDLALPAFGVPVVKMLVPSARMERQLL